MDVSTTKIQERRRHRRLALRLPLEFERADACRASGTHTMTENVSTGGAYFETAAEDLKPNDPLVIKLAVPTGGDDRFPQNSQISTVSKVIRSTRLEGRKSDSDADFTRYGVAVQFQQPLKLSL